MSRVSIINYSVNENVNGVELVWSGVSDHLNIDMWNLKTIKYIKIISMRYLNERPLLIAQISTSSARDISSERRHL